MSSDAGKGGPKTWTQEDMELALDALRNHNMSLTKASATYGIPSTTLWQRAHRMGIDTPKKEGPTKSWTEENLNNALEALRTGTISANKASKAYGEFHYRRPYLPGLCWHVLHFAEQSILISLEVPLICLLVTSGLFYKA